VFLRSYVVVARRIAEVEAEMATGAENWMPDMVKDANGDGEKLLSELGFNLGKRRIGRRIKVEIGAPKAMAGLWGGKSQSGGPGRTFALLQPLPPYKTFAAGAIALVAYLISGLGTYLCYVGGFCSQSPTRWPCSQERCAGTRSRRRRVPYRGRRLSWV
jgi:hypothetical protein